MNTLLRIRSHWNVLAVLACSFVLFAPSARAQENGHSRHARIFAVPAPGPVTIDGKLDDWDLSGELETYVMAATRHEQYARMAIMYDADALYIGGEVQKVIPQRNRHDPAVTGDRGWDADAVQVRFTIDSSLGYPVNQFSYTPNTSDKIIHLLLWRYTDTGEACLQAKTSMQYHDLPGALKFGVVPHDNYQAAYVMSDGDKHFTFEYRIPWKTLNTATPPKAGDLLAATYQFNFGRADGLATAGMSGWAYDLQSRSGFAFQDASCWGMMVFSPRGHVPPDSVDAIAAPSPPAPLELHYQLPKDNNVSIALYNNKNEIVRVIAADQPRKAGDAVEHWDGLDEMNNPLPAGTYTWKGIYHDPITTKYLLSVNNSGQPAYKTNDNTGSWGGDHGFPAAVCALNDSMALAWRNNEAGFGLIATDFEGRKKWGIINSQSYLAAGDGKVYACTMEFGNGLSVYDPRDGRPLSFANGASSMPFPPGIDYDPGLVSGIAYQAGKVYVAFHDKNLIAVYDAVQGTLITTWNITAPGPLTARPDGTLAAIVNGQLVQLDADGKTAPLITDHIDAPAGLAVAPDGTIYVANNGALQNVSVFSPTGAYVKSIGKVGGRPSIGRFDPSGMLSPRGIAIDKNGNLWVMECIDFPKRVSVWDAKTGKLWKEFFGAAHYSNQNWMDPHRPNEMYDDSVIWKIDWKHNTAYPLSTCWRSTGPDQPAFGTHTMGLYSFTAKNGKQYGWDAWSGTLFIRVGDVYQPMMKARGKGLWIDANLDGQAQNEELFTDLPKGTGLVVIDKNLKIWGTGVSFSPVRILRNGAPVYDFHSPQPSMNYGPVYKDEADDTFYAFENGYDKHGAPGNINYGRFNMDGSMVWGYRGGVSWPNALRLPPQRPGKIWGATQLLGDAGDFTGFATYYGCHHIYTRREGLPVAMLFRDTRLALGHLGPDIIACENYNGQIVKPEGQDRYLELGGDVDGRILEVDGLDTVKYLSGGAYTLTDADVKRAADAITDYRASLARAKKPMIVRGVDAIELATPVEATLTPEQYFRAKLAHDDKNLYVQYNVTSPVRLTNSIAEPNLIFKGGNLLDIQLATDPTADPARKTPAPGDVRLLISRRDGKPFAMIYRPKVKGFTGTPIVLTSPTGKESFDVIEQSNDVKLSYTERGDGFVALVTIPLSVLNWMPQAASNVRLDLGYIFGTETGNKATGRAYWANTGPAAGILNDIPSESRLVPNEWGEAEIE